MHSTVFGFNIVLRREERESYILDSKMNNISFDFKTYRLKDISVDFSLTSQFRINNDDSVEYEDIEEYCPSCKYRYYINGMHGYCGLVYIESSNIELIKREVLVRKSNYDNILVAGEFHFGRFLRTWPRYLIRGNKRIDIITVHTKEVVVAREDLETSYPVYEEGDNFGEYIAETDDTDGIVCDGSVGAKNIGIDSYFYKIIENDIRYRFPLYCEKIFELSSVEYEGNFKIIDFEISFDDEVLLPVMHFYAENSAEDYSENNHKYGIISINTYVRSYLNGMYSGRNRIQIEKGVQ